MSLESRRRKCLHCGQLFTADYRNAHHQRYCSDPPCRQASHRASQRRWRRQPENRDVVRGPDEVERVREWRRQHPGYWKRKPVKLAPTLLVTPEPGEAQAVNPQQTSRNVPPSRLPPLQDVWLAQDPAFVGLISLVTGSTLREDIAATARQLLIQGQHILGLRVPLQTTILYDRQRSDSPGAVPPGAQRL